MLYLDTFIVFIILLVIASQVVEILVTPENLREIHMLLAAAISSGTMAGYLWWQHLPLSVLWCLPATLAVCWIIYRLAVRRPNQMILWDKIDFRAHLLCLAVAILVSVKAAPLVAGTAAQVAGMGLVYSLSWLLLFPL